MIIMQGRAATEGFVVRSKVPDLKRWCVFNLVGGLGILVQLTVLETLTGFLRWNYLVATAAAVEAAVLHNFLWHERWTWVDRSGGGARVVFGRLVRFHLANGAFSLAGNLLLMKLFAGVFAFEYVPANILSVAVCSILNFFAGDRLVFVPRPSAHQDED